MFEFVHDLFGNPWFIVAFFLVNFVLLWHYSGILGNILSAQTISKTKYVLITGCDRGIGYRVALDLSVCNCTMLAGCLTENGVNRLRENPAFKGEAFLMDITKEKDIEFAAKLVEEKTKEHNGLYAVINNAGILSSSPIDWQSTEEMKCIMDVNFWGTVNVSKAMLPFLKKRPGRIINISSMAGRILFGYCTGYTCSKYAVEAFTDGLRYEMKPFGIKCSLIEPGMFKTDILDTAVLRKQLTNKWRDQSDKVKGEYGEGFLKTLTNRFEEIIGKLASPDIHKIVSNINHAVTSSNPKSRYVVGVDAKTVWMAMAVLPTSIGDWILNYATPAIVPDIMLKKKKKVL